MVNTWQDCYVPDIEGGNDDNSVPGTVVYWE